MKKILSAIISLIILVICGMPVCAEEEKPDYNISIGYRLEDSDDAKDLDQYRSALVKHINRGIEGSKNKKIKKYSFRFSDPSTCYAKYAANANEVFVDYAYYYDRKLPVTYNDILSGTIFWDWGSGWIPSETKWDIKIMFDIGLYEATFYRADTAKSWKHYHLGGQWYIENEHITADIDDPEEAWRQITEPEKSDEELKACISAALAKAGEKSKDIRTYYCTIGTGNNEYTKGFVIFADGQAKYILAEGLQFRSHRYVYGLEPLLEEDLKESTPKKIKNTLLKMSSKYWSDISDVYHEFKPIDQWRLFNYNKVVFLIKNYEKYYITADEWKGKS